MCLNTRYLSPSAAGRMTSAVRTAGLFLGSRETTRLHADPSSRISRYFPSRLLCTLPCSWQLGGGGTKYTVKCYFLIFKALFDVR